MVVIISIISLVIILLLILYIVYRMRRSDLDSITIIKKPFKLYNAGISKPYLFRSDKFPQARHGQEYTYSFWLYITSFEVTSTHKVIMMRGFDGNSFASASHLVYMDGQTNKLYFSVRSNQSITNTPLSMIPNSEASRFLTGMVEYVPIQRWVHFAMVVKDNLLTIFMDGEIYTVENVLDLTHTDASRPIFSPNIGDLNIGSLPGSSNMQGYIQHVKYYNHALSLKTIKHDIYDRGPFSRSRSVFGQLGLADYGVRSPVYKTTGDSDMDDDDDVDDEDYDKK